MQIQNHNPIITVVRDPSSTLGKRFDINPDGTIRKKAAVSLSLGIAVQRRVPTHDDLAKLLNEVGNDPYAAIINASFPDIPIGEEFVILSEREIESRLGIPSSDRARQSGVHQIEYDGKTIKAAGRFKENVHPSSWQLLDRDVDAHTPDRFTNLSMEDWLAALAAIIPGVDRTSHVVTPSTSSRVLRDGNPVSSGNGHVWVLVDNPGDIERARSTIILRALQADKSWTKPRYSKLKPGAVVGRSHATILDPSVWTPGRLVFAGQPSVGDGLTVLPMPAEVRHRDNAALDTAVMVMPDRKTVAELSQKTGVTLTVTTDNQGVRITADDLTLEMEIETKDDGIKTVRELTVNSPAEKQRCQTPFRDSESWAAFIGADQEGMPFLHDVGTGVTHWLNAVEQDALRVTRASAKIDEALPAIKADSSAALGDNVVPFLGAIKQAGPAEYQRKRAAIKQENGKVSLAALDSAVKAWEAEKNAARTHHGYAKTLLAELTEGTSKPVGFHNALFVVEPDKKLWISLSVGVLVKRVADLHDGKNHCSRSADYKAIAEHAVSLADDAQFFASAPAGIACPGGFYQLVGDTISLVPLTPEHRQRVMLSIMPAEHPTPHFKAFLHETFDSERAGEEQQQMDLVQEIAGAVMLGLMPRHQKAVLFYEPFGRAGKGTLERILRNLVPATFVTAVSPFRWSHDYHVAHLAGSRLNVVGELPENEAIPASSFKSVIGGDLVTGRHPTHRPITFANEAAHLFMSNHLITTKDQSEAFYSRWLIVDFPNSRLRSGLPIDPGLAERIIASELPGIAYWALEGARRLIANGDFSRSTAHERLMAKWRRSTSSLGEFIHECCELQADCQVRRSELYSSYTEWCSESGRKPFSKARVKELLEHNIGMGVRWAEVNGYEVFRGLKLKPADTGKHQTGITNLDDQSPAF
jgi:putative DNA primase/helicase